MAAKEKLEVSLGSVVNAAKDAAFAVVHGLNVDTSTDEGKALLQARQAASANFLLGLRRTASASLVSAATAGTVKAFGATRDAIREQLLAEMKQAQPATVEPTVTEPSAE